MEIKCDHLLISLSAVNATRYVDCWSCCLSILAMIISLIQWTSDDKSAGLFLYFIFIIHSLRIHQKCTRVCVVFSDISSGRVRCSFSVVISFFQLNSTWCFIRPVVRDLSTRPMIDDLFFSTFYPPVAHTIYTQCIYLYISWTVSTPLQAINYGIHNIYENVLPHESSLLHCKYLYISHSLSFFPPTSHSWSMKHCRRLDDCRDVPTVGNWQLSQEAVCAVWCNLNNDQDVSSKRESHTRKYCSPAAEMGREREKSCKIRIYSLELKANLFANSVIICNIYWNKNRLTCYFIINDFLWAIQLRRCVLAAVSMEGGRLLMLKNMR